MRFADGFGFLKITRRWDNHSGFTLYRLHHKADGVRRDGRLQSLGIPKGNDLETGRKRTEPRPGVLIRAEPDYGDGPAVKVVFTDDNFRLILRNPLDLVSPFTNRLDNGFHGLSPTVHGKNLVGVCEFAQLFIEQRELIISKCPGGKGQVFGLVHHGFKDLRMAVSLVYR